LVDLHREREKRRDIEGIDDLTELKLKKRDIVKKRIAAQKVMDEKEREIKNQLRGRLLDLEENHANDLLEIALEIDVEREVSKRMGTAKIASSDFRKVKKAHEDKYREENRYDEGKDRGRYHAT
jgi:hypothetical protein